MIKMKLTSKLFIILSLFLFSGLITPTKAISGSSLREGVYDLHVIEDITLRTSYKCSKDFVSWRISNNKAIDMKVEVISNNSNKTILISHMHADIFIESKYEYYDDILQDSMDDYLHGSDQSGFLINSEYPYTEIFSIEGSSPEFLTALSIGFETINKVETYNRRFSEETLINEFKIFGQTLYIVYDILIKTQNETLYHKVAVSDNIYIDTNGSIFVNNADVIDQLNEQPPQEVDGYEGLGIFIVISISAIYFSIRRKRTHGNIQK